MDKWWALVATARNLQVPKHVINFLSRSDCLDSQKRVHQTELLTVLSDTTRQSERKEERER
jgi:hypothetical protein